MKAPALLRRLFRRADSSRRRQAQAAAYRVARRAVRMKYDAAGEGEDLRRYWAFADDLSAKAANNAAVRRKLRSRSRYEAANNTYACGLADTLANETIGTGPKLQLLTKDSALNRDVEARWARWAESVDLAGKLRMMRRAKAVDGEVFLLFKLTNADPFGPQLDVLVREADYCTSGVELRKGASIDGLELDDLDHPIAYHFLPHHPGDSGLFSMTDMQPERMPADQVIHYFDRKRPGQCRGVPELTPALPLFAQLRRYTLATLTAAEYAADFSAILESQATPGGEDEESLEPMDVLDIERGMMTVTPKGWALKQFKAEQPTTVYGDFKEHLLSEIGRCVGAPFNIIAGNSSKYNYASGRLDYQVFRRNVTIERRVIELDILKRIFFAWLEAETLAAADPLQGLPPFIELTFRWIWDGFTHIDEQKTAAAQETRIRTGVSNLAQEIAAEGRDWEVELAQASQERYEKLRLELELRRRLAEEFEEEEIAAVIASSDAAPSAVAASQQEAGNADPVAA